jgi:hypothetical protein
MAALNRFILTFLVLLLTIQGMAQSVPLLERKVTLELSDEPVEKALKRISKEAKITFSYTSSDIDIEQNITASFKAKTVREILELIFKGNASFKEKGNYIILAKVPPPPKKTSAVQLKNPLFINGYILDAIRGEKISGVSVYDTRTLTAAVSNNFGYFSMMLKEPQNENTLAVSRKNYTDTLLVIKEDTYVFINIPLSPETLPEIPPIVKYDTISMIDTIFVAQQIPADTIRQDTASVEPVWNIGTQDTIFYSTFQGSVVPFVGTNGKQSDKTINDYSFNLFGGYSGGTKKLELGGLFNIDLGDVSYIQLAGLMNFNEGRMRGFQAAGLFNTNRKGIKGFQVAGITNVNSGRSDGVQLAGIVNIQTRQFRGAQVAGVMNFSKGKMKGVQVAPLVNYARNLKGVQIAFINIADTLRGVPIGFISFVRRGYHKLEISADEIFYTNIAFRTGTHKFYNIFTLGVKPESDPNDEDRSTEWTFGYGFGMAPYIFDWLNLNIDLTCNQLSKGEFTQAINLLNKAYVGLEFQPFDRIGIAFGVTLNGHLTKNSYEGYYDIFTEYQPRIIKEHDYNNNTHLTMWWGFKGAIRFF